ncbi:mannitol dehydrogenase family protein [Catenovulum adriaticum]|uniref:Mannitol dehydrogenase family protein n=1 Tax=Catenovulum adriaticum TaxID=2984846 RepID=A0ABY7ARV1_9ALTE|nr:mannitol dehydrogenase family protein [Catenovulum sp. TS8]WAJ72254.1 mannitol dehydrogenase family protein [Catenovulum sp. TS8]
MKLNNQSLQQIKNKNIVNLRLPQYNRTELNIGIVHLGLGAFHRSHQAFYTEQALNQFGGDWGICAVSMRNKTLQSALATQDNLYTIAEIDQNPGYQVIGAIKEVLVAAEQIEQVLDRLTASSTKLVTLTVTEKGYCLNPKGDLDIKNELIQADLNHLSAPKSAIGIIVQALKLRFESDLKPFNIIACDNLPDNGKKLKNAVTQFANQIDPALANWIENKVAFPCTMVDSITPQTDDSTVKLIQTELGFEDLAPVQRESFTQWVIEDCIKDELPNWEEVGVIFTQDVARYEHAKLRVLNGLHSAMAYIGSVAGYETVYEAVSDTKIKSFLQRLLQDEILSTIQAPKELNLNEYADSIIKRFENPNIKHYLSQIAFDGSIKVPVRSITPLIERIKSKKSAPLLSLVVASWIRFLRLKQQAKSQINDPIAIELNTLLAQFREDANHDIELFIQQCSIFSKESAINNELIKQVSLAYKKVLSDEQNILNALS